MGRRQCLLINISLAKLNKGYFYHGSKIGGLAIIKLKIDRCLPNQNQGD